MDYPKASSNVLALCVFYIKKSLFHKSSRTSKERKKWEHERVFNETLKQYEDQEFAHLNDLTYDPATKKSKNVKKWKRLPP
jgi:hypothetical protein